MPHLLEVSNLHVKVGDNLILQGVDMVVNPGEIHVLMGPNGAGKSTLVQTIMGHPAYEIVKGSIKINGEEVSELSADKRAKLGAFLSFQNPYEVAGVTLQDFLRQAKIACTGEDIGSLTFYANLVETLRDLDIDDAYALRYLNVGFSGGEKKKSEMLQMSVLDPSLAMLDEPDSGLDVDAVRVVSQMVKQFFDKGNKAIILITHHNEIMRELKIDHAHILKDGRTVLSGGTEIIDRIEAEGYGWIDTPAANEE